MSYDNTTNPTDEDQSNPEENPKKLELLHRNPKSMK